MQILDTFPAQQQPHFCIFWQTEEAVNFILHCQVQYHILQFHKTTKVSKVKSKFTMTLTDLAANKSKLQHDDPNFIFLLEV